MFRLDRRLPILSFAVSIVAQPFSCLYLSSYCTNLPIANARIVLQLAKPSRPGARHAALLVVAQEPRPPSKPAAAAWRPCIRESRRNTERDCFGAARQLVCGDYQRQMVKVPSDVVTATTTVVVLCCYERAAASSSPGCRRSSVGGARRHYCTLLRRRVDDVFLFFACRPHEEKRRPFRAGWNPPSFPCVGTHTHTPRGWAQPAPRRSGGPCPQSALLAQRVPRPTILFFTVRQAGLPAMGFSFTKRGDRHRDPPVGRRRPPTYLCLQFVVANLTRHLRRWCDYTPRNRTRNKRLILALARWVFFNFSIREYSD